MCGIIGIIGPEEISSEVYTGLISIQHRGQDSAGIYTYNENDKSSTLRKNAGLVGEAISEEDINDLKGSIGIGHVRYPTIGSDASQDAQPFTVENPLKIGMAHNGNIANYGSLKKKTKEKLESTCDLELVLNVFKEELEKENQIKKKNIFKSIKRTMGKLNGSYSVVSVIPGIGLVAFRDPKGIKPLVIGRKRTLKGKSYGLASENIALDILEYQDIEDVNPGEAIIIDEDREINRRQIKKPNRKHCMFEWVYFARTDSTIEGKDVYKARLELGRELAKLWKDKKEELDVVFPVPETARTYAVSLAEEIGKPYREGLIKNRYVGRTFIMPDQTSRKTAIKTKLNPIIREIKGKKVGLVDDSIVRGNTSKKIINLMRESGAEEVHFFVGCPPILYPCFYGIDMPTEEELIASNKSKEEIKNEIGADTLTYQTIEGLTKALGFNEEELCLGCLNNNYPTHIGKRLKEYFKSKRKKERS